MCRIEKNPTHYQIVPVNSNLKKKVPLHRYIELPPKIKPHVVDTQSG